MTSTFEDIVETVIVPQLLNQFASSEIIDYTSADGTTTDDITAIIGEEEIRIEDTEEGDVKIRRREVWCHRDPTSDWSGIADPDLNGTITYAGHTWHIREVLPDSEASLVHFEIVRIIGQEYTRPNLRRA